jgi:hypothetical protein
MAGILACRQLLASSWEDLDRHVFEPLAAHQQDDRHFKTAPAHDIDERGGLALEPPIDYEAADRGVVPRLEYRLELLARPTSKVDVS